MQKISFLKRRLFSPFLRIISWSRVPVSSDWLRAGGVKVMRQSDGQESLTLSLYLALYDPRRELSGNVLLVPVRWGLTCTQRAGRAVREHGTQRSGLHTGVTMTYFYRTLARGENSRVGVQYDWGMSTFSKAMKILSWYILSIGFVARYILKLSTQIE